MVSMTNPDWSAGKLPQRGHGDFRKIRVPELASMSCPRSRGCSANKFMERRSMLASPAGRASDSHTIRTFHEAPTRRRTERLLVDTARGSTLEAIAFEHSKVGLVETVHRQLIQRSVFGFSGCGRRRGLAQRRTQPL
jgi:hypothetical protein